MRSVRYGARASTEKDSREVEAARGPIWSRAATVVFETDADVVAQVLPKPLSPAEPLARLRIAVVDMGSGTKPFGAGWFGVRARHGSVEGEYALFMPMTTEQATIGGRETFGEPKKLADVALAVDGGRVTAHIERMGFRVAQVDATVGPSLPAYDKEKLDFYFKVSPSPGGRGLDSDPALVYTRRRETGRSVQALDGELKLLESPLDPVADFPLRRIVSMQLAEISTSQSGEVVGHVPAEWLVPFVHQRYDDLSLLGGAS
jgi:acetoacetate decarboxylase